MKIDFQPETTSEAKDMNYQFLDKLLFEFLDGETKSLPSDVTFSKHLQARRTCLPDPCYLELSKHLQGM